MQEHKYSIKEWAKNDRPREKLLNIGAKDLTDSELLAILIQNGSKGKTAVDLGKEVLKLGKDNLAELGKLTVKDLMKVKGIGEAKAITIAAALELGRRRQSAPLLDKPVAKDSEFTAQYIQARLKDLKHEVFGVLFLNRANKITRFEIISEGGITGTIADPRIILKKALDENAVGLIICHNHPSGNLHPSQADKDLTRKIKDAAQLLDIKLLDHIIISESGYFSFSDEGLL